MKFTARSKPVYFTAGDDTTLKCLYSNQLAASNDVYSENTRYSSLNTINVRKKRQYKFFVPLSVI